MATSGGQPGNQNAARAKRWQQAIMRALARKAGTVDDGLDKAADQLVTLAIDDGDKWALEELGNRIEGKVAQSVTVAGDENGNPIQHNHSVEWVSGKPPASS